MIIKVMKNIMSSNQEIADKNREFFKEKNIKTINIMASPGAGKTSLIMKIIENLRNNCKIYVVEGDIASKIDADKIEKMGIDVLQINTGGGCHLDANMIDVAVDELKISEKSFIFIENVGNLVCPSSFDLGESVKMVVASVPEGDDKPYKYISMFEEADIVILNKLDIIDYIDFNKENFINGIRALNKDVPIFEVSCKTGEGLDKLYKWFTSLYNN